VTFGGLSLVMERQRWARYWRTCGADRGKHGAGGALFPLSPVPRAGPPIALSGTSRPLAAGSAPARSCAEDETGPRCKAGEAAIRTPRRCCVGRGSRVALSSKRSELINESTSPSGPWGFFYRSSVSGLSFFRGILFQQLTISCN